MRALRSVGEAARLVMKPQLQIVRPHKQEVAQFQCSACGADRGCDCNAPAVEKANQVLARNERKRMADRERIQAKRDVARRGIDNAKQSKNDDNMPTEKEAEESYQTTLYDQACLLLESMAGDTRQRFFAHLRRKYHVG
jgi:hypothetical protein